MIQRIQSIFLLLAAAALVLFNFIPLGVDTTPDPDITVFGTTFMPLFIVSLSIAAIALVAIFLFNNRALQIKLSQGILFLIASLIGLSVFFLFGNPNGVVEKPGIGLITPILALVFSFLALRNIKADEKLVRSIDRLR